MSREAPTGADPRLHAFIRKLFVEEDEVLRGLRAEMEARELPLIEVPQETGKVIHTLIRAVAPRRVLEVGTLAGYSAIWIGRALPDGGRLLSLELREDHAELAREFLGRAGLSDRVEVRVGDARELLPGIGPDGSFDVVFLDADKESYPEYLEQARRLLRPGGLLLADNALWQGKVLEEGGSEADRGIRAFDGAVAADPDFTATVLPVGDGVLVAVKGWG